MRNATILIPPTHGRLTACLPILLVCLGLATLHAVQAQAIEVVLGIHDGALDNMFPRNVACLAGADGRHSKPSETAADGVDAALGEDVFERVGVDVDERRKVLSNDGVEAGAVFFSSGVDELLDTVPQTSVKAGFETAASVIHGTYHELSVYVF
jgi:hypothetical protein